MTFISQSFPGNLLSVLIFFLVCHYEYLEMLIRVDASYHTATESVMIFLFLCVHTRVKGAPLWRHNSWPLFFFLFNYRAAIVNAI